MNERKFFKKITALALCLCMVAPMLLVPGAAPLLSLLDGLTPQAGAATVTVGGKTYDPVDDVVIVVPETIYLKPSTSASTTAQYFVNNAVDANGNITLSAERSNERGALSIYAPGATHFKFSTKLTSGAEFTFTENGTSNSVEDTKWAFTDLGGRTGWAKYDLLTGSAASGVAAGTAALIEWTFTLYFGDSDTTGKTYYAYTTAYNPFYLPVGAAARARTSALVSSKRVFASSITWVSGVHGFSYGKAGTSQHWVAATEEILNNSDSGRYYPTESFIPLINGVPSTDTNDKNVIGYMISDSASGIANQQTIRHAIRDASASGATQRYGAFAAEVSPVATMGVDISRYSNFNQIPNFTIGFNYTDAEKANETYWYISDFTDQANAEGRTSATEEPKFYNYATHGSYDDVNNMWFTDAATGNIISGSATSITGVNYGAEYPSSVWNRSIVQSGTHYDYVIKGAARTYARIDSTNRQSYSINYVQLRVTNANKSDLRKLVLQATGLNPDNYTTTSWGNLKTALRNAALCLGNPAASDVKANADALEIAMIGLKTKVTFNATANGGTMETGSAEITTGANKPTFTVSSDLYDEPQKGNGWDFVGWNTDKDATTALSPLKVGFNSTLYAIFRRSINANFYYYDENGRVQYTSEKVYIYGDDEEANVTIPTVVSEIEKNGKFKLLGFRADKTAAAASYAVGSTVDLKSINENAVQFDLYAVYSRDDLWLDFQANGGEGAPEKMTATAPQYINAGGTRSSFTFTVPSVTPTRDGYNFLGWAETSKGTVKYQAGSNVAIQNNFNLWASWAKVTYTITFEENEGSSVTDIVYADDTMLVLPVPTRYGYEFTGWTVKETVGDCWTAGDVYPGGQTLSESMTGDVTLVAGWEQKTDIPYMVIHHYLPLTAGEAYKPYVTGGTTYASAELTVADLVVEKEGFEYDYAALTADGKEYTDSVILVAADGTTQLHLFYKRVNYAVTTEKDDGIATVTETAEYKFGATATLTATVKPGYEFINWTIDGEVVSTDAEYSFVVEEAVTVKANTAKIPYTITYIDGINEENTVVDYVIGSTPEIAAAPVRAGYTFNGWLVAAADEAGHNWPTEDLIAAGAAYGNEMYGSIVLTAQWTANEYTVTFDENGGAEIEDIEYTIENEITLPEITHDSLVFVGWKVTTADGNWEESNALYAAGTTLTEMYGNVTLTAQYATQKYVITFIPDGGKVDPAAIEYDETTEALLPEATRLGYRFLGWKVTAVDDSNVPEDTTLTKWSVSDTLISAGTQIKGYIGSAELTAQWEAVSYNLTVNTTNIDVTYTGEAPASVNYGEDFIVTFAAPTGYILPGKINVKIDGKGTLAGDAYTYRSTDGYKTATLTIKGSAIVGDVIVTAAANLIEYKISYVNVLDNHEFATVYNYTSETITIGTPVRAGYVFAGWTTADDDTLKETVTIPKNSSGDKEFIANWISVYSIRFDTNGGSYVANKTFLAGETVEIPATSKTDGSKFLYWKVTGAWAQDVLNPGTYENWVAGDVLLTAVFTAPSEYKVETYIMDTEGNYGEPTVETVDEDVFIDSAIEIEPEAMEGFTLNTEISILKGVVKEDEELVLKVYYSRNQQTVTVTEGDNVTVEGAGTYYYGEEVTVTATPADGYIVKWAGVENAEGNEVVLTIGTQDIALDVTAEIITYTATFIDGEKIVEKVYNITESVTVDAIAKDGYVAQWIIAENDGNWDAGAIVPGTYSAKYGDVTFTATYTANEDTQYTLEIWYQNIKDDEYTIVSNTTEFGTTDTAVLPAEEVEGFTLDTSVETETTIGGNGKTVVKYYYLRNIYTLDYIIKDDKNTLDKSESLTYKFGAEIEEREDPAYPGYRFVKWDKEIATVMPAENLAYTAEIYLRNYTIQFVGATGEKLEDIAYDITKPVTLPTVTAEGYTVKWNVKTQDGNWFTAPFAPGAYEAGKYGNVTFEAVNIPNENTPYVVEIYIQNLDGEYELSETKNLTGKTDDPVVKPEEKTGFITPDYDENDWISGDGKTVVKYYYERESYTVTYEVLDNKTVVNYLYDQAIEAPATPEVDGYEFVKWNAAIADKMPAEDLTYTAEMKPIEYTITFDEDGGSEVADVKYDITREISVGKSEKENFGFVEWVVTEADGNWKVGDVVDTFSGKYGNITVQAKWSANKSTYITKTYTMDVNGNYGEPVVSDPIEDYVGKTLILTAEEKVGFTVDAQSVLTATLAEDGSTVLSVYYSRNKYSVTSTIKQEGKEDVVTTNDYFFEADVVIKVENIGTQFMIGEWTGVEATGDTATFKMPAEDVNVSVTIVPLQYTVTLDYADGVTENLVYPYAVTDSATIPGAVERAGYEFAGWTLKATDNHNWTDEDIVVGKEVSGKYGNVTLVATWTAKTYTFSYNVNEGVMSGGNFTPAGEYTIESNLVLPDPTREGYRFRGWLVTPTEQNDTEFNWEARILPNAGAIKNGRYGNVTLTAVWYKLDVAINVEHHVQATVGEGYLLLGKYVGYYSIEEDGSVKIDAIAKHEEGKYAFENAYVTYLVDGVESDPVLVEGNEVAIDSKQEMTIKLYYKLVPHTVTVTYVTPDGVAAPAQFNEEFLYGQTYNIQSPKVKGHTPSSVTVYGKMDVEDVNATITYTLSSYDVVVKYRYENGAVAAKDAKQTVNYGADYAITSPAIDGYTASVEVVKGTMDESDVTVTVVYTKNAHKLTINYLYEDGSVAADAFTANLTIDTEYNEKSPVIDGYDVSSPYVSGVMGDADVTINVIYSEKAFNVIFRDYDGTDISVQKVKFGAAATAPADPVRANDDTYSYTFKGWSEDFSNVTGDMIITAQYTATNLSTGEVNGDDDTDNSFFGRIKAFFERIIRFFKILFMIT